MLPLPRHYDPLEYWIITKPIKRSPEELKVERQATADAMARHGVHACYGIQCKICHPPNFALQDKTPSDAN